jgi:hypothetical protein
MRLNSAREAKKGSWEGGSEHAYASQTVDRFGGVLRMRWMMPAQNPQKFCPVLDPVALSTLRAFFLFLASSCCTPGCRLKLANAGARMSPATVPPSLPTSTMIIRLTSRAASRDLISTRQSQRAPLDLPWIVHRLGQFQSQVCRRDNPNVNGREATPAGQSKNSASVKSTYATYSSKVRVNSNVADDRLLNIMQQETRFHYVSQLLWIQEFDKEYVFMSPAVTSPKSDISARAKDFLDAAMQP